MTHLLPITSPRRPYARRFGLELRKALKQREVGYKRFAELIGGSRSTMRHYLSGGTLPRLATAEKMDLSLDWDGRLVAIVREGRTVQCSRPRCPNSFVNDGGTPRRYCSDLCHRLDDKARGFALGAEYIRGRAAMAERRLGEALITLEAHQAAVAAMCASCEPEGFCHMRDCDLRSISPLPMARSQRVPLARKAPGAWGTAESSARQRAALTKAREKRWAKPEERQKQAELTRRMRADGTIPRNTRSVA